MEVMMMGRAPMLRSEEGYMEKRQVFLRSYHFSRKRTTMDHIRRSLVRVRRLILVRLRSARSLPLLIWCRLRLRLRPLAADSSNVSSSTHAHSPATPTAGLGPPLRQH